MTLHYVRAGFSLVELLLAIALMGLLTAVGAPVYYSFLARSELQVARDQYVQALYRAQSLTGYGFTDASWGVFVATGTITLFRGTSYITRNQIFDESYSMPLSVSVSGLQEVVYSTIRSVPVVTGTTTFSSLSYSGLRSVYVGPRGALSY